MPTAGSIIHTKEELRSIIESNVANLADRTVCNSDALLDRCLVRFQVEPGRAAYARGSFIFFIKDGMYALTKLKRLRKYHDPSILDEFRDAYGIEIKIAEDEFVVKAVFNGIDTGYRYDKNKRSLDYNNRIFTFDVVSAEYITRDIKESKGGSQRAKSNRIPPDKGMSVIGMVVGCPDSEQHFGIPVEENVVYLGHCTRLTKVGTA